MNLSERLVERAQECAAFQAKLDAEPGHKDAGQWVAEIARLSLTRAEERHLQIVRAVRRMKRRIRRIEAMPNGEEKDFFLTKLPRLRERIAELSASANLITKEDLIDG